MEVIKLLRRIKLFSSFDKLDGNKSNEIINEILKHKKLIKIHSIVPSHFVIFFLTNKFIRSKEFNDDWGEKENKVILIILLEEIIIPSSMNLDLNEYFVINFYDSISGSEKNEVFEKINRVFISRLVNLMKLDPIRKDHYEINSDKVDLKMVGKTVTKIELIGDNYALLTYDIKNKEIMIINLTKNEIVGKIGELKNSNIECQYFCWLSQANKIFCFQKLKYYSSESNSSLFDLQGNFLKTVFSVKNNMYDVKSVIYSKETFEICLNVSCYGESHFKILILNEKFDHIKSIDRNLLNSKFSLNYASDIKIFEIEYYVFNYDANIAILQEKERCNNVYVFDKSSYTVLDVTSMNKRPIIGFGEQSVLSKDLTKKCVILNSKRNFKININYLVHKLRLAKYNLPDSIPACKLNTLKNSHLLSNPHVLPCGNLACLECIYNNYNPIKQLLKCEICKHDHKLPPKLQPLNKSSFSDLFTETVFNSLMNYNQTVISKIGKKIIYFIINIFYLIIYF